MVLRLFIFPALVLACWASALSNTALAQPGSGLGDSILQTEPTESEAELVEKAIRKISQDYMRAFESRNAAGLAAFWSVDAAYTNRSTGEVVNGRDQIANQFKQLFEEDTEVKLILKTDSVRLVSPNVAVEYGTASMVSPDQPSGATSYTAVYIRQGDNWLIDRVTDEPIDIAEENRSRLSELAWMIGTWIDEDDSLRIETECRWTKNNGFITRSFTVESDGVVQLSGMQLVGWDPKTKAIRSWTFDSEGGFSEGTWTRKENKWFIKKQATLRNGGVATATNIITYEDDDSFLLRSTQRTEDGRVLPSTPEVRVVRATTE